MQNPDKGHTNKILLLGASFDTGNLGVSALAESSIKCICRAWPNPTIYLFGSGREDVEQTIQINEKKIPVINIPVRFNKKIFLSNHYITFFLYAILFKIVRIKKIKNYFINRNKYLKRIIESKIAVDITGGDSFSDIYGSFRFIMDFLRKYLVLLFNKNILFLPQTYGPFHKKSTQVLAKFILKRAVKIYSRDKKGLEYLQKILNKKDYQNKVELMQDLAFTLDPEKPTHIDLSFITNAQKKNKTIIGLNISGLIYNGGYTKNNMFKLKVNYIDLINQIIDYFMQKKDTILLLVPHVIPDIKFAVESDPDACSKIYEQLPEDYKKRIYQIDNSVNHKQIKYIIGQTDFFLGSRMHACIGALSQYIPAIGLAYSRKFYGVYETITIAQYVANMYELTEKQILDIIDEAYTKKKIIQKKLETTIKPIKENIINILVKQYT